jgi:hypothetical protein
MSPLEARKIIEALANGIDPETGEILPAQNTLNSPQVIRALFIASKALDKEARRHRATHRKSSIHAKAGSPWSVDEDKELLAAFDSGIPVNEIAQRHGRTQGAIAARLVRLGRIKERSEVYFHTQPEPVATGDISEKGHHL